MAAYKLLTCSPCGRLIVSSVVLTKRPCSGKPWRLLQSRDKQKVVSHGVTSGHWLATIVDTTKLVDKPRRSLQSKTVNSPHTPTTTNGKLYIVNVNVSKLSYLLYNSFFKKEKDLRSFSMDCISPCDDLWSGIIRTDIQRVVYTCHHSTPVTRSR